MPPLRGAALALGVIAALVLLSVGALSSAGPRDRTVRVESFARTGDETKIVVTIVAGLGDVIVGSSAREDDSSVVVGVRIRPPSDGVFRHLVGISLPVVVHLEGPLRDRVVLDERGERLRDLGMYHPQREPPVDLGEIGVVERARVGADGTVELAWRAAGQPPGTATASLRDLRGSTVVILSRTSFSGEGKQNLLAVQDVLRTLPPAERARVVLVVITLNEDPARAAVLRPSALERPLVAYSTVTGTDAPEVLRFDAVPVAWFVGPDGRLRHRVAGVVLDRSEVQRGLAAAR